MNGRPMQIAGPRTDHRPRPHARYDHRGTGRQPRRLQRRPDVVVVSADPELTANLQASLVDEGLAVTCMSTGPQVAERIVALAPRVVFMEVSAAADRPWELPLALGRTDSRTIPVIVVAEGPWGEAVGRCLLAGVRIVVLPQERARLVEAMERATTTATLDPTLAGLRLATLRTVGSGEVPPTETAPSVRLTRLERPLTPAPTRTSASRPPRLFLDELGSAQRRIVEGLVNGRSPRQIAADAGVTTTAVYGAWRRLSRRLGVPRQQLPEEVRRRFAFLRAAADHETGPPDERTDNVRAAGRVRRVA